MIFFWLYFHLNNNFVKPIITDRFLTKILIFFSTQVNPDFFPSNYENFICISVLLSMRVSKANDSNTVKPIKLIKKSCNRLFILFERLFSEWACLFFQALVLETFDISVKMTLKKTFSWKKSSACFVFEKPRLTLLLGSGHFMTQNDLKLKFFLT